MSEGRIFMNGRSQAVRLPKEFRLTGSKVKVSRLGNSILLTPIPMDVELWYSELDRLVTEDFFKEGRNQPPALEPENPFD